MFCVYEGDHITMLNVYNAFLRVSWGGWGRGRKILRHLFLTFSTTRAPDGVRRTSSVTRVSVCESCCAELVADPLPSLPQDSVTLSASGNTCASSCDGSKCSCSPAAVSKISRVRSFVEFLCCVSDDPVPVQRAIVSGFFANAARLHYTGCYR